MWKHLRKFLSLKTNYSRENINYYLKEFVYRSKNKENIFEFFINDLKHFGNINLSEETELNFSEYEII